MLKHLSTALTSVRQKRDYDYVSPGFLRLNCDRYFPQMTVGNRHSVTWRYFRKSVPHRWYIDRRYPGVGFLNRDESSIVASNARLFRGKPGLEIGTWRGWSACHIALSGVDLDVIDPLLRDAAHRAEIAAMLEQSGVSRTVRLHAGSSPTLVETLGRAGALWSFVFVDGDHEAPAPAHDTLACLPYLAADAMILFHDLMSPDVAEGLFELRARGWSTLIYQTSQIMGVAWRGAIAPLIHHPDPRVDWDLPPHLASFTVCGEPPRRAAVRLSAFIANAAHAALLRCACVESTDAEPQLPLEHLLTPYSARLRNRRDAPHFHCSNISNLEAEL